MEFQPLYARKDTRIVTKYTINIYYPGKSDPETVVNVQDFQIDEDGFVKISCVPSGNFEDMFVFNPRFYSYVHVEAETEDEGN